VTGQRFVEHAILCSRHADHFASRGRSGRTWQSPVLRRRIARVRPIFGRDVELELVDRFLERVQGGLPILVIEGDPGIGKTTLWAEAVRRAEARSFRLLKANPAESEAKLPYAALGDLIGEAFAEVGPALPVPQERALATALLLRNADERADSRTTATAVVNVITRLSVRGPVVVAIDDVQWLDAASDRVLAYAVRRLPQNVALVLSSRLQAAGTLPLGLRALEDRINRLSVGRLSLAALHNLIASRLEITLARPTLVRVAATSDGNPFFALEMARALKETGGMTSFAQPLPVPSSLRELVAYHLRGLSATATELVTVAAALSRPSIPTIVAAIGSEATAHATLAEAEDAGVIILEGDRIRFAHPLLASAVYGSLSAARRRQLHGRLAGLTDDIEESARHVALSATRPDEQTAEQMQAAGRHAALRGAPDAAAELFEAACRLTPSGRPLELARRMLARASASLVAGNLQAAGRVAAQVVCTAPLASMRSEALVVLSDKAWGEGLPQLAREDLEAALREAGDDRELAPHILAKLVEVTSILDPARALMYSQAVMDRLTEEREPGLLALALFSHVYAEALLGRRPNAELFNRGLELEARTGAHSRLPLVWYLCIDDFEAARARHEVEDRWCRDHGDEPAVAERLARLGLVELHAGRWNLAERYIEEGCTTLAPDARPAGPWIAPLYSRAVLDAHMGRTARARITLTPMIEESGKEEQSFWAALLLSALGFVEFAEGRHEAVDRAMTAMHQRLAVLGAVDFPGDRSEPFLIESLVALGRLDRARQMLARLEARSLTFPRLWITVTLPRARALIAAGEGDLAGAVTAMAGTDSAAARSLPFEHGRNQLVFGRLLRRAKQRRAAAQALGEALAIFAELGAPIWIAEARSELERVGMRRAPNDLTATERRVVELAAQGMTNRDVAAALFISPKTVEANLARAYDKLAISSRAELGARARELGLTRSQT
jgi:DNA-binding CsgD family transcriptional regulator